ncbi:MAG: MBOAT family protein [Bacteroidetes bacterium]|nr:MBOAT family protein [Bacteroidota bacterium]
MVFSSPIFLFYFLPIVLLLYLLAKRSIYLQNMVLFFASLVFYFWGEKEYSILVMFSILVNYFIGIWIHDTRSDAIKKIVLGVGIVINISLLIFFKYYNFIINDILHSLLDVPTLRPSDMIHLPLGISFFTFHGLTYITDIYRKEAEVSRNPLNVGLYVLFFPQLIAGPIVRYKDIDTQLRGRSINSEKLYSGTVRFIIGLAKKVLIANTLGNIADQIFALEHKHVSGSLTWLALLCYTLQIYYDFSGYSDMAIGLARVMGFEFLENFNFLYSATSIKDFWRRWHISLSTFFRDYVYIPLGGNKKGVGRTYLHLLIIFFLTGLWHGASWNYLIWGLFHGFFLIIERAGLGKKLEKMPRMVSQLYTLFIVVIAWLFFRIEHVADIEFYLKKLFFIDTYSSLAYYPFYYLRSNVLFTFLIAILFVFPVHQSSWFKTIMHLKWFREIIYVFLFILSLAVLSSSTYNPFIYFRF